MFICDKRDPRCPLLSRLTPQEKIERNEKFDSIIKFVQRRDLDREYVKVYKARKDEVWRIKRYTNDGRELVEDQMRSGGDAMNTDYSFLNNQDEEDAECMDAQSAIIEDAT